MKLLDTDVCIDLLRKQPEALAWFAALTETPGIPGFVALELVIGCRDTNELRRVRAFLRKFALVWPTETDLNNALTNYAPLKLAHGIGGMDVLIAATVTGRGDTLLTLNVRHFRAIPDLTTELPYTK
jgi:predicted nucleic acid-binding protein